MKTTTKSSILTLLIALFFIASCKKEIHKSDEKNKVQLVAKRQKDAIGNNPATQNNNYHSPYDVRGRFNDILFDHRRLDQTTYAEFATLPGHADLMWDLGADDITIVEIIMDVESEFNIEIPDDQVERLHTIDDYVNYILQHADDLGQLTPQQQFERDMNRFKLSQDNWEYSTPPAGALYFSQLGTFLSDIESSMTFTTTTTYGDNERILTFKTQEGGYFGGGELLNIKIVKDASNKWTVASTGAVSSEAWGFHPGTSWQQDGVYTVNTAINNITVEVGGFRNYHVVIESFGVFYSQRKKFRMIINNTTGTPISFTKIN